MPTVSIKYDNLIIHIIIIIYRLEFMTPRFADDNLHIIVIRVIYLCDLFQFYREISNDALKMQDHFTMRQ